MRSLFGVLFVSTLITRAHQKLHYSTPRECGIWYLPGPMLRGLQVPCGGVVGCGHRHGVGGQSVGPTEQGDVTFLDLVAHNF